jgi:hypothetical protein
MLARVSGFNNAKKNTYLSYCKHLAWQMNYSRQLHAKSTLTFKCCS